MSAYVYTYRWEKPRKLYTKILIVIYIGTFYFLFCILMHILCGGGFTTKRKYWYYKYRTKTFF